MKFRSGDVVKFVQPEYYDGRIPPGARLVVVEEWGAGLYSCWSVGEKFARFEGIFSAQCLELAEHIDNTALLSPSGELGKPYVEFRIPSTGSGVDVKEAGSWEFIEYLTQGWNPTKRITR